MCSSNIPASGPDEPSLAARLARAIDELAAAASRDGAACPRFAELLASTWALLTAADPDLAARKARY